MGLDIDRVIKEKSGIQLDIGAGENKQKGFVGLDKRPLKGIDIVHDLEVFPYPLPDESCLCIVGSHIIEHIKPWVTIDFWNELWRIMKPGGQMALATPYGKSEGYIQDPTHCNPYNVASFQYFDPRYPLFEIYKPSPWELEQGFPVWQITGNLEAVLRKITREEGKKRWKKTRSKR